jgi:hypothetical protein
MTTFFRAAPRRRARIVTALAAGLAGLFATGYFVASSLAVSGLPVPVITGSPSNPTTASSATFTFTDSQAGVKFTCSLDSAPFVPCTSGITYHGLAQGDHTFRVEAISGAKTSGAATYSWAIIPPTPTILAHPANPTAATTAFFMYSDGEPGMSFKCSLDGSALSPCAVTGQSYSGLAEGTHTFIVVAQRSNGPQSAPASYTWRVDTTAPAITVTSPSSGTYDPAHWAAACSPAGICGTAADPSGVSGVAVGIYQASSKKYWNGSSFSSSSLVFVTASGTTSWHYQFTPPQAGGYTVYVRATDSLGNTTPAGKLTSVGFTYITAAQNFAVGGSLTSPLYPGTGQSLDLTFTNPSSSPITIPSGGVSAGNITITTNAPGCASSNFAVTKGLTAAVTIPAGQTTPESLSALGVPQADWPVITMIETNTNQDACQGAKLTLTYSGIEATG